jgi:hypothetical protein
MVIALILTKSKKVLSQTTALGCRMLWRSIKEVSEVFNTTPPRLPILICMGRRVSTDLKGPSLGTPDLYEKPPRF